MKYILSILTGSFLLLQVFVQLQSVSADTCATYTGGSFTAECNSADRAAKCTDENKSNDAVLKKACENSVVISPFGDNSKLPTFADLISFVIKGVFLLAGIFALIQLIRGALDYIQSGGDSKKTEAAQNRIRDAVVGAVILVVVFAIAAFLEGFLNFGLGITRPLIIPSLIK